MELIWYVFFLKENFLGLIKSVIFSGIIHSISASKIKTCMKCCMELFLSLVWRLCASLHKLDSYLSQTLVSSALQTGVSAWFPPPLYSRYIFVLAFICLDLQCWKDYYFFLQKVFNAQQIFMTPFMAQKQNTQLCTFSVNQPLQNKCAAGKREGQFSRWTSWSQRKSLILHRVTCWNMNLELCFHWTLFNCLQQWCHLNTAM